jgi:hypothetical protein
MAIGDFDVAILEAVIQKLCPCPFEGRLHGGISGRIAMAVDLLLRARMDRNPDISCQAGAGAGLPFTMTI